MQAELDDLRMRRAEKQARAQTQTRTRTHTQTSARPLGSWRGAPGPCPLILLHHERLWQCLSGSTGRGLKRELKKARHQRRNQDRPIAYLRRDPCFAQMPDSSFEASADGSSESASCLSVGDCGTPAGGGANVAHDRGGGRGRARVLARALRQPDVGAKSSPASVSLASTSSSASAAAAATAAP